MRRHPAACRARPTIAIGAAALMITITITATAPVAAQEQAARPGPPVLFEAPLADLPGKNLVVVELSFPPNPAPASAAARQRPGHRHPGSVFVYVTDGTLRLGLAGQDVQVVPAGGTFFEPPRAHHVITENASATEPARAIAVMIVPDGEPLVIPEPE